MSNIRDFTDKNTQFSGTDGIVIPVGNTDNRPSGVTGTTRYNSSTGSIEFYDGANWISTNLIPTVSGVSGNIINGTATSITITVVNGTEALDVVYSEGGIEIARTEDATNSSGSVTVSVPAAVYNQTVGDVIAISVANQDGTPSSNTANLTVRSAPTGGSISNSGSYRIHTFTSSGTFTIPSGLGTLSVEYLVIGGGGAGSKAHATNVCGGGGAGGYRTSAAGQTSGRNSSTETPLSLGAGSYTVEVGGGGTCDTASGNFNGSIGLQSTFHTITSNGGGAGGGVPGNLNVNGGAGGGAGSYSGSAAQNYSGGSGTSGQGFDGGNFTAPEGGAGGGAGAGANGASQGGTLSGGNGGNGLANNITGGTITRAGGGGGAGWNAESPGSGGSGGGGNASITSNTAQAGGTNTGGGGGAAKGAGVAGNGGSGLVVVRYQL